MKLKSSVSNLKEVTMIGTLDDNYDRSVINVEEVIGSSKFVTLNGIYSYNLKLYDKLMNFFLTICSLKDFKENLGYISCTFRKYNI